MPGMDAGLQAHLEGGLTTVAHAWAITRKDGVVLGFTDHDRELSFDGITFRADTGLSAVALSQSTGLSVDNTEALGALSDLSIREDEIEQGRFDEAAVEAWLVNWQNVDQRWLQFRGSIGELRRADGGFQAELRGLTELLNRPLGRVYQTPCTAVLGDSSCRFDMATPGFSIELPIEEVSQSRVFRWEDFGGFDAGWFTRGRMEILSGAAAGLWGMVKQDRFEGSQRVIELWEPVRSALTPGQTVRLIAGCDKRSETCRMKFSNLVNFQGFPDVPGEDWMIAVPKSTGANTGGSRR
ncbi:hypothetical protein So717_16480 [Roseobacter cerasinus]|uniref:Bacteriophage phiJL001 Gp84 C-terminal domain-containing protein n=1 Tax=Roseobacter cerasinus TaxID=2602289 RepID=A0A640VSM3_9RHOB|nr:DUF2163 domain-containing protein [Roseobacter cerasinus]GFE49895.1 hypothetical protein So717_16480 [Roseobacter cerasinus]